MSITVSIPAAIDGRLPSKFSCDGDGVSPEIQIVNVPPQAKSLVLHVVDYDVPKELRADGTFHHWIVWNINPDTTTIPENGLPAGAIQGKNSAGQPGYTPACPPNGEHRYVFRVFALDTKLDLSPNSDATKVLTAIGPHEIARGESMARYARP